MSPLRPSDLLNDDAEQPARLPRAKRAAPAGRRAATASAPRPEKLNEHRALDQIVQHAETPAVTERLGAEGVFNPTFTSSRHERAWIFNYLGPFYDDKQITDVLARVKGGKEANVYCCAAHPGTGLNYLAAKLYRPREFRHLRNDLRYRQGRAVLDDRGKTVRDGGLLVAIRKKTSTGMEAVHTSWLEHEYQTLVTLHAAGADVPRPVSRGHSTILMEFLGEPDSPAPLLQSVRLEKDEAQPLFERVLHNVGLMLANQIVHGDLSAYNILYWEGDIRLIDFPQVVHPADNAEAFDIFARDVERLCQYFARQGVRADAAALAADLWAQHGPRPKTVFDDPPYVEEIGVDDVPGDDEAGPRA